MGQGEHLFLISTESTLFFSTILLLLSESMADPIIANFLSQYPGYTYNYSRNDDWRQVKAFNAMAYILEWSQERRQREYQNFKDTWVEVAEQEFEGDSLEHFTSLCEDLKIDPGQSIRACKEKLRAVNVNLVDLIQYRKEKRAGSNPPPVRIFDSAEELMEYSEKEKKTLPAEAARAGMLRVLLKLGEE